MAVIRLLRADDLVDLPAQVQEMLRIQAFTGELGQRAVVTTDEVEVCLGAGPEPSRRALRAAVAGLGLASGSHVRVELPAMPGAERVADLLRAELAVAGYNVDVGASANARADRA